MDRISVLILGVTDMDRAVRFWRDVMGLRPNFTSPAYSEFRARGAALALETRRRVPAPTGPAFAFATADVRRNIAMFRRRGARIARPLRREPFGLVAIIRDSEGNLFEVVEYRPAPRRHGH